MYYTQVEDKEAKDVLGMECTKDDKLNEARLPSIGGCSAFRGDYVREQTVKEPQPNHRWGVSAVVGERTGTHEHGTQCFR